MDMNITLLRALATKRVLGNPVQVRYDPIRQISEVYEDGVWVPSFKSVKIEQTKKCDMETGEDQKGQ